MSGGREHLEAALSAVRIATWEYQPATGRVTGSDNLASLYGLDDGDELPIEAYRDLVREDHREHVVTTTTDAMAQGQVVEIEFPIVTPAGERWLISRAHPISAADGHIERWLGVVVDITAQKRVEESLRESERRFRELADAMPHVVWTSPAGAAADFFNRRWFELFGESTVPSDVWGENVHPDDRDRAVEGWQSALSEGTPTEMEFRLRNRVTGEYRWHLGRVAPAFDTGGAITRWYGTMTDIHERKVAEDRSREGERELREILDAMPAVAVLLDAGGRATYRNAYWRRMIEGRPLEDVANRVMVHPDDREWVTSHAAESIAVGEPFEQQYRLWDRVRDEYRWYLVRYEPLASFAGDARWLMLGVDVHEQRMAEETLRQANALKEEFIGFVSHELRSPLTVMLGTSGLLLRRIGRVEPEALREFIQDIHRSAERLSDVVENLLALSFAGRHEVVIERLALPPLAEQCLRLHGIRFPDHRVELSIEPDLPEVFGNATWFDQILGNMLVNAAKYAPCEEPLEVELRANDRFVTVHVRDRGPGIDPEARERVFEAFVRGDDAPSHGPGAGLGLAVCRRLVEGQGGEIWHLPREGGGSEFGFSLPLAGG